jgi:hypothetical protein
MPDEVVDHAARQSVAVLQEALLALTGRLDRLCAEVRDSSTRVVWAVIVAVAAEVVLRLLRK